MLCGIHMESHPNHLTSENLKKIVSMGVRYLSTGVEAIQAKHLQTLKRTYTVDQAKAAIGRALQSGFECVNVDYIFALPDQTMAEVEEAARLFVDMGVDQVATYPLFRFPYTKLGENSKQVNFNLPAIFRRRRMLQILEGIFYNSGYERSSVWAFTKKGIQKYCSVTVPRYLGLGASGGTYLNDIFYVNTFNVSEYVKVLKTGKLPVALSVDLTENMQLAGWLYWRIYETRFLKSDFKNRFNREFDNVYGKLTEKLSWLGYLKDWGDEVILTDKGTYWLHAFEDIFSIDYISKLWGTSKLNPWPEEVVLN